MNDDRFDVLDSGCPDTGCSGNLKLAISSIVAVLVAIGMIIFGTYVLPTFGTCIDWMILPAAVAAFMLMYKVLS